MEPSPKSITNTNTIINKKISKQKITNEYYELKPVIIKEHNMRLIKPYEFKYQLYTKGRWVNRKLLDVLISEFRNFTQEYFIAAINTGKILINYSKVEADYTLKRNDFITHMTIRKENPIIDQPLEIIYNDKDFLVVNKPSSWPVHVCGGYQFNTLQRILMDEYGHKDIKVLHRLDKHTSGCVLFAKNKNAAERFRVKLHSDSIQKIYFARVKGDFKHQSIIVKRSIVFLNKSKGIYTDVSDEQVEEYNKVKKSKKKTLALDGTVKDNDHNDYKEVEVEEVNEPKYAETSFEKLFYDENSNTSVVICKPKTGRTHQIRIHLRYLGFPIANDPCYGGVIYNDLKEFDNPDLYKYQFECNEEGEDIGSGGKEDNTNTISTNNTIESKLNENKTLSVSQMYCYKIWLHSWAYKFESYSFETSIPPWAKKDYKIDYIF